LSDVLRVSEIAYQMEGEAVNCVLIFAYEIFKGILFASKGSRDQIGVIVGQGIYLLFLRFRL
jgi:hypothetical protein